MLYNMQKYKISLVLRISFHSFYASSSMDNELCQTELPEKTVPLSIFTQTERGNHQNKKQVFLQFYFLCKNFAKSILYLNLYFLCLTGRTSTEQMTSMVTGTLSFFHIQIVLILIVKLLHGTFQHAVFVPVYGVSQSQILATTYCFCVSNSPGL